MHPRAKDENPNLLFLDISEELQEKYGEKWLIVTLKISMLYFTYNIF